MRSIEIFNRKTAKIFTEIVYSKQMMQILYGNKCGIALVAHVLGRRWLNYCYGFYHNTIFSKKKIPPFVKELSIDCNEGEFPIEYYRSFNHFFARRLRPELRPISSKPNVLVSPADGRVMVFPKVEQGIVAQVKWAPIRLLDLFGKDQEIVQRYENGSCVIIRLAPADYHRFHFPLAGVPSTTRVVNGILHSVSPYALEQKIPVHTLNKRTICQLASYQAGLVVLMEVGALLVGSIRQTYTAGSPVASGDEKGFFEFGGSTVIMFFEPGRLAFDRDLCEQSSLGRESMVFMGEQLGFIN
jgi:phosphatidylserine decarboxylase